MRSRRQLENSVVSPWKSITNAPRTKTSGAKIRFDWLSATTALSTASSSFSLIAFSSARPCRTTNLAARLGFAHSPAARLFSASRHESHTGEKTAEATVIVTRVNR